jgi:hypothetical protein
MLEHLVSHAILLSLRTHSIQILPCFSTVMFIMLLLVVKRLVPHISSSSFFSYPLFELCFVKVLCKC